MARAVRTFNTDNCQCDWDHDSIEYLTASTLHAFSVGQLQFEDERAIGVYVAGLAEQVGWVKAGDELEDLHKLLDGVTGLDEVGHIDFEANQKHQYEAQINNETASERVGLAMKGNYLLFVQWDEGEDPREEPATVVGIIQLDIDAKRDLIARLEQSIEEDSE
jgi:hypothetical protein